MLLSSSFFFKSSKIFLLNFNIEVDNFDDFCKIVPNEAINCFLIRDPDLVTASFLNKWNGANPMDLGYKQQLKIFNLILAYIHCLDF